MSDEEYIKKTAIGTEDEARQEVEPSQEEINYTPLIDKIEEEADTELDEEERGTIEELLKEEYDASDVVKRWEEWTEPLQPDTTEQVREIANSPDEELIKSTGMAHIHVDAERPELEEMSQVRKQMLSDEDLDENLNKSDSEDSFDDATLDALWKGTETAREAVAESAMEDDSIEVSNQGPSNFDKTTLIRLAATHGVDMAETSKEAGELASDFVKEYIQLSEKDLDKIDINELAYKARRDAMTSFVDVDSVGKGRRYISDPSEAPEGADVEQGPQGGYYYEVGSGGDGDGGGGGGGGGGGDDGLGDPGDASDPFQAVANIMGDKPESMEAFRASGPPVEGVPEGATDEGGYVNQDAGRTAAMWSDTDGNWYVNSSDHGENPDEGTTEAFQDPGEAGRHVVEELGYGGGGGGEGGETVVSDTFTGVEGGEFGIEVDETDDGLSFTMTNPETGEEYGEGQEFVDFEERGGYTYFETPDGEEVQWSPIPDEALDILSDAVEEHGPGGSGNEESGGQDGPQGGETQDAEDNSPESLWNAPVVVHEELSDEELEEYAEFLWDTHEQAEDDETMRDAMEELREVDREQMSREYDERTE